DFVPHVTLIEGTEHIDEGVVALAGYRAEVVIDRVHLLRELDRSWSPIADAPLGGRRAVIGRGGLELELTTAGVLPPDATRWVNERWDDFDVERFGDVRPKEIPVAVVARREGRIVGAAEGDVRLTTGEAYLAQLIVAAHARGEGIGAHTLAAF